MTAQAQRAAQRVQARAKGSASKGAAGAQVAPTKTNVGLAGRGTSQNVLRAQLAPQRARRTQADKRGAPGWPTSSKGPRTQPGARAGRQSPSQERGGALGRPSISVGAVDARQSTQSSINADRSAWLGGWSAWSRSRGHEFDSSRGHQFSFFSARSEAFSAEGRPSQESSENQAPVGGERSQKLSPVGGERSQNASHSRRRIPRTFGILAENRQNSRLLQAFRQSP